jgi:hypothetical protein
MEEEVLPFGALIYIIASFFKNGTPKFLVILLTVGGKCGIMNL